MKYLFILPILLYTSLGYSEMQMYVKVDKQPGPPLISLSQINYLDSILKRVEKMTPPKIRRSLNSKIVVKIEKMGGFHDIAKMNQICGSKVENDSSFSLEKTKKAGRTEDNTIYISNDLLKLAFTNRKNNYIQFPCLHKTMERTLIATLLHEVAHIFLKKHKNYVSDRFFLNVINFKKVNKSKSVESFRDSDNYTNFSAEEAWATYFEYFLLDRKLQCYLPTKFAYFSKKLNHFKKFHMNCGKYKNIFSHSHFDIYDLTPSKVGSLDYILVGRDLSMQSLFGHSMVKINLCSEKSILNNYVDGCREDGEPDIVLTIAANLTNFKLDPLKGVFGGYKSKIFIELEQVNFLRYNFREGRHIVNYPLKLNREQINLFITKTTESFWSYRGDYKFITNNCATETHDLFKYVFASQGPIAENIISPNGLLRVLKNQSIIDSSKVQKTLSGKEIAHDHLKRLTHSNFHTFNRLLPHSYDREKDEEINHTMTYENIRDYTSPKSRMRAYKKAFAKNKSLARSARILEKSILDDLVHWRAKRLEQKISVAANDLEESLKKVRKNNEDLLSTIFGLNDYGIPTMKELVDVHLITKHYKKKNKTLFDLHRSNFLEEHDKKEREIKENLISILNIEIQTK